MARKKIVKEEAAEMLPQVFEHLAEFADERELEIHPVPDLTPVGIKSFDNGVCIQSAENPRKHGDGSIILDVLFAHVGVVIPFAAHDEDEFEHGNWLYDEAVKGTFGEVLEWDRPLPSVHDLQVELDKLMPDIILGLADEKEISLAKALRIQIKAMS